ncbi:MAG TPA: hypothetical protein VGQ18_08960 [Gemmatimonadales bacterium]|jgi:hypothetical protein|nr:hypothetical protein [Gemmatimonadales bacterium]
MTPVAGVIVALLAMQTEGSVVTVLPGSTRSAGLAGAGAALVGEAGAVFANPAGIATIHHLSLEGSYEPYLAGTAVSSAAVALRVGRVTWGFGAQTLDYGSEPEIVPDPATSGRRGMATGASFHPYEALAVTSLVLRRGLLAFGVSAKYNRQQIGSMVSDAWAGDVGMAVAIFDIAAFGVSVQNLGGDLGGGARMPRRTRAGFTFNYTDPQGAYRLLTTLEAQWTTGRAAVLVQGVEGGVVTGGVGLVGRLGYATRPAVTDASRFTFGGGVLLGHLQMDYAFQAYQALGGGTHRVGVRWTP